MPSMPRTQPVVAVAGDPGGAAALLPLLRKLFAEGFTVHAFAYRQALTTWQGGKFAISALPETNTGNFEWPENAGLCLTATSVNGIDWEPRFWEWARQKNIPTLAILDYWNNLSSRFLLDGHRVIPDRIAVMDDAARDGLVASGIPAEAIVITGHPAFDELPGLIGHRSAIRSHLRHKAGIPEDATLIVFVSQPLSQLRRQSGFADPGYDELDALSFLLETLAELSLPSCHLVIRPHPRENADSLQTLLAQYAPLLSANRLHVRIDNQGNARYWVLAADLVCGMYSVLLQEACYLETPVLSLQPNLRGEDPLPANRQGLSLLVTDPAALPNALTQLLFDGSVRASLLTRQRQTRPTTGATHHAFTLAQKLLGSHIQTTTEKTVPRP